MNKYKIWNILGLIILVLLLIYYFSKYQQIIQIIQGIIVFSGLILIVIPTYLKFNSNKKAGIYNLIGSIFITTYIISGYFYPIFDKQNFFLIYGGIISIFFLYRSIAMLLGKENWITKYRYD